MSEKTRQSVALSLAAASLVLLYWPVFTGLVRDWANDDNYSHGFVILPFAAYFAWERRHELAAIDGVPRASGLGIALLGLALLLIGRLGADLFMTRISLLIVLTGGLAFVWGWNSLRVLLFPLTFLLLMIPLPTIVFNQIAFPLQLFASQVGEAALTGWGIPVLREGNVMVLANTTLEVAEACSGIRSLVSLITLGIVYSYFTDRRNWVRVVVTLSTIPIAIAANGLRVAGTGIAAHYYGPEAATGFIHEFSGWVVFVVASALLVLVLTVVRTLAPEHRQAPLPIPQPVESPS